MLSPAWNPPRRLVNPAGHARGNATRHFLGAPTAPSKHGRTTRCSLTRSRADSRGQCRQDQPCEYRRPQATSRSATASTPEREWFLSPPEDNQSDFQTVGFPTILFLDPGLLQYSQLETVDAVPHAPSHILHLLGDLDAIRITAERFFGHIHRWMPFISKKRFYDLYLQPSFRTRSDVVLLLLAMKLITAFPPVGPRSPRTALYHATKHFYVVVEDSLSILVLQAGLLVALYELGHGIYPAAFLSIGACARYAYALGINVSQTVFTKRVITLVEVEERRRVWWALVVLDRFVTCLSGFRFSC